MLSLAITLATRDFDKQGIVSFGQVLLSCFYHGLSYASRKHFNGLADIPYWLLQAWEEAYLPIADTVINALKRHELTASILTVKHIEYFANKDNTRRRTSF